MTRAQVSVAFALLFGFTCALGCGDDAPPPTTDAAVDADGGDGAPTAVAEPMVPALPAFLCPAGWRTVTVGTDPPTCEPWPEGGAHVCTGATFHLPGQPDCLPIGSACPAGDFPSDLPATNVLYVSAGAASGDGTESAPFGTIGEALALAAAGTVVAVAAGAYAESFMIGSGVTVRGVCPASTVISSADSPVVVFGGTGGTLRDVTVGALSDDGVTAVGATSAIMRGVIVEDAGAHGVRVDGAALEVSDVLVRGGGGVDGVAGIFVDGGGTAQLTRVVIEGVVGDGLRVTNSSTVTADELVVHDNTALTGTRLGVGIRAQFDARIDATLCVLERNVRAGALADRAGATLHLEHCVSRDNRPDFEMKNGLGMAADNGGVLELVQGLIEGNIRAGIRLRENGTARLTDVVVRDTTPQLSTGEAGFGLTAALSSSFELTRVAVLRSHHAGVSLVVGSDITASDLWIADVESREEFGVGGHGLSISISTMSSVERALIERARETGIGAHQVVDLRLTDVVVRAGAGRGIDDQLGDGMTISGTNATFERVLIDDVPRVGLWVGAGGTVTGSDVQIRSTRPQDCAVATCTDDPFGMGLGVYQLGQVTLDRFVIEDSSLCGLQIATGGEADLSDGRVSGSVIGACVQNDGYDFARLSDRVLYTENDQNLQSSTLATPDPAPPISGD